MLTRRWPALSMATVKVTVSPGLRRVASCLIIILLFLFEDGDDGKPGGLRVVKGDGRLVGGIDDDFLGVNRVEAFQQQLRGDADGGRHVAARQHGLGRFAELMRSE